MRHLFAAALVAGAGIAVPAHAASFVNMLSVPNGTDLSGYTGTGANRLGGFGSDLIYNKTDGLYYGMTDRGPGGGVLPYAPRIQAFSLGVNAATGAIHGFQLEKTIVFTQNGSTFDGLNPQLLNGNPAILGRSFDPEGLALLPSGNFLVSDEYGPSVYEFTPTGEFVRAFQTPANLLPKTANGTADYLNGRGTITSGRQDNRGFEGLTVSPDGKTAYAILQDPLVNEGANGATADGRYSRNVRMVAFDIATGQSTGQFVYQLEDRAAINARTTEAFSANDQGRSIGVSAIQALGDGRFLVLERDNRGLGVDDPTAARDVASKRLYVIDIKGATDVSGISLAGTNTLPTGVKAVGKSASPFLDIAAALKAMGLPVPEKIEGFSFGPRLADGSIDLLIVTDNDFSVTQSGGGTQFDVCTTGAGGQSVQVALGAGCPTGYALIPNYVMAFRLSAAEYAALVPEPETWAMMVLGFGMVGAVARRRRKPVVTFA